MFEIFMFLLYLCFKGTTKLHHLECNIGCLTVELKKEDLKEISDAVPCSEVAGERDTSNALKYSWKFSDTPPKVF